MSDLISLVIPVYNVDRFLDRCVQSIVNQSYDNLEIILVDDGSTDKSGVLCDKWAREYHNIIVIHKENGGLSSARNAGIEVAHGKYISFIDSDDFLLDDAISYLYNIIGENDIAIGNYIETDGDSIEAPNASYSVKQITGREALQLLFTKDTVQAVTSWAKLYKSILFQNIRYTEGMLHEDEATTYKLYYSCNRIVISDKPVYAYFQNRESISRRPSKKNFTDLEVILKDQISFFTKAGLEEFADKTKARYCIQVAAHYLPLNYFYQPRNTISKSRCTFREISMKNIGFSSYIKAFLCAYFTPAMAHIINRKL